MATVRQLSFAGGEITPALWGRTDQVKYATGLKTCLNFIVMRHGGAANRPGTVFSAEVKDSTKTVRLIPFIFSSSQAYVLEFGDQYIRFYYNGAQVTETAQNITGITQANPCVVTINNHGYSNGDEVYITGVGGMTELNNRNFKVANAAANTFSLQYMDGADVDSTSFGAYTSGGTAAKIYEIGSPYVEADLFDLQYIQSADVMTIVHPSYDPRELARTGHTSWTLTVMTYGPTIQAPTNITITPGGAGSKSFYYALTSIDAETFEESYPQFATLVNAADPTPSAPHQITWTNATGAGQVKIYRKINGVYGWIGTAGETSFDDTGYTPDTSDLPPELRTPYGGDDNRPSTVAYYQQRLCFANTNNNPEQVKTSRTGLYKNFTVSTPLQDDDAITFSLVGKQVNEIKHLLDLGRLIIFTSSGEWIIQGDASGILTPDQINPKQYSAIGSSKLPPLVVQGNALYVQARGSVVRDLAYDFETDSYKGNELTIFAAHLFNGYTLVDWAYQQIPHSIIWAVRNDGVLLGLTYVREHQVFGWHRHNFNGGTVESVCVIPGGLEDVLYLVIKRTINRRTVRYVEWLKTRQITDIRDAVFMDSSLSYDGRNTDTNHTMTLSGGTNWTYDESLTLTSSISYFTSDDIGNAIWLTGSDGTVIRCTITAYTSGTVVTVTPHKTVPSSMRNAAISTWSKAVDEISGLWHIEGEDVSILADGLVEASPNNSSYIVKTVSNGKITLDHPHAVIHVGLPYTSDMETLNIDYPSGKTLADKKKHVSKLTMFVQSSRGIWAGPDANNLTELKIRSDEDYDEPVNLATGTVDLNIKPEWNSTGSVFIRQIDPLPLAVLAIIPAGYLAA